MDYKEKFEGFLDKMQGLLDNAKKQGHIVVRVEDLENAFPELCEPDDEKIRKFLIKWIQDNYYHGTTEIPTKTLIAWLENQGQEPTKVSIWKHWKDGICGNGEGKLIYLIKNGVDYSLSSSLGYECDYILLSDLDNLMLENQGKSYTKRDVDNAYVEGMAFAKNELEKQGEQKPILNVPPREVILSIWDLGNEWKELTNGCISTEYGTQLDYIQKHWHESEYYLREKQGEQKLPIEKLPEEMKTIGESLGFTTQEECDEYNQVVSDLIMSDNDKGEQKQKSVGEEIVEALRTEYEKGRADAIAEMQKEWSDKEKQMYADIIEATKKSGIFKEAYKRELVDFLNSLKERYAWKPSDKQMNALDSTLQYSQVSHNSYEHLNSLYNDLKKLKGE